MSLPARVERELEAHDAFERIDGSSAGAASLDRDGPAYDLTTTVFDVAVAAADADGTADGRFEVVVALPSLSAAVADGSVGDAVADGWYETLERRLGDAFDVARTDAHEAPALERTADRVIVRLAYVAGDAAAGVADAKSLVEYVEGTYAQGLIPGYEYRGPAATLLANARERGQGAADAPGDGGERDGTPL